MTIEDAECERIMKMTLAEIIAEIRAQGRDPIEVISEVDRVICAAKVEAYRRRMKLYV